MHEIAAGIRNKGISTKAVTVGITTIYGNSRSSRKISGYSAAAFDGTTHLGGNPPTRPDNAPWFVVTDAKDLRCRTVCSNAQSRARHGITRICRITGIKNYGLQVIAIAGDKAPTVIIERCPMLPPATFRTKI